MPPSSVTNGLADSCATITARRLKRFAWQGRAGSALHPLVSAELARGVRTEIPRFFNVVENVAAKILLFFRESAAMDILTIRPPSSVTNGLVGSRATITARRADYFVVVRRGRALHLSAIVIARFDGVGAWCARRNSAVFFRKSVAMDILITGGAIPRAYSTGIIAVLNSSIRLRHCYV